MDAFALFALPILAAFGGALAGGFLARVLLDRHFRPCLSIERRDDSDDPLTGQGGVSFHRVVVTNRGRRAALNCRATIDLDFSSIHNIVPGGMIDPSSGVMTNRLQHELVCWSPLGNPHTVSIYPGQPMRLDLCTVQVTGTSPQPTIIIPSEAGWKLPRVALRLRSYDLTLVVGGENCAPEKTPIRLVPSGGDVKLEFP